MLFITGLDPSQMGMFMQPGHMPCFPGTLMPQPAPLAPQPTASQPQTSESNRDNSSNDDPLMTLARAAGSSPMLSPIPQTTSTSETQDEGKVPEQEGATSSTDILSRAVSQSGMQLSPDPHNG